MSNTYTAPEYLLEAFNCPHCNAYSDQRWITSSRLRGISRAEDKNQQEIKDISISICRRCGESSVWIEDLESSQPIPGYQLNPNFNGYNIPREPTQGKLIYPPASPAPMPLEDIPEEIKSDYMEARDIVNISPRGAAALLRLCVQKLMIILGEKGKSIDEDIASLVKQGLSADIQKSLDILRVIGNESVYPGTIDLNDDRETALKLFKILNLIIYAMITQPKMINELYQGLPQPKLDAISKRDNR